MCIWCATLLPWKGRPVSKCTSSQGPVLVFVLYMNNDYVKFFRSKKKMIQVKELTKDDSELGLLIQAHYYPFYTGHSGAGPSIHLSPSVSGLTA